MLMAEWRYELKAYCAPLGPTMKNCPEHGSSILFVETVFGINFYTVSKEGENKVRVCDGFNWCCSGRDEPITARVAAGFTRGGAQSKVFPFHKAWNLLSRMLRATKRCCVDSKQ